VTKNLLAWSLRFHAEVFGKAFKCREFGFVLVMWVDRFCNAYRVTYLIRVGNSRKLLDIIKESHMIEQKVIKGVSLYHGLIC